MASSKVYEGFQTIIPAEIRKKFNIKKGDTLNWTKSENKIILVVKKKSELSSIIGLISDDSLDSVEATKKVAMGEKPK